MNYQESIFESLKEVTERPTKNDMQFAYVVLHQGLGLSPKEAIKEAIEI